MTHLYIVQSGSVSVFLPRAKQSLEMYQLGPSQILGDQAVSGMSNYNFSAVALTEVKAIEMPVELVKNQIEGASQIVKLVFKSAFDRLKFNFNEIKSLKLEKDNSPCPPDMTAKAFGAVFHAANHTGEKKPDGSVRVDWRMFKQYTQRIFMEPNQRTEQVVNLLVKLKLATTEMIKDEENEGAAPVLGYVNFKSIQPIEQFFEFFQYYQNKAGKGDMLKSDDSCVQIVNTLMKFAPVEKMDRSGVVKVEFPTLVAGFKEELGMQLNTDHFNLLEKKGLFVKRSSTDDNVFISFDYREFERTLLNWKFLKEVEKWNEKGFVDLKEDEPKKAKAGNACPSCKTEVGEKMKFCSNCGSKLAAAA